MKIFIVTPCFNASQTIDRTIASVLMQAGDFELCYHVQDGGSTDGTIDLLKVWEQRIVSGLFPCLCKGIRFSYASAPDAGMYDAIAKGFDTLLIGQKDWMAWINADDIFAPGAFELLRHVDTLSENGKEIRWVTGAAATTLSNLQTSAYERFLVREVIAAGLADGTHWDFVQQEGTFFRRSMWDAANPAVNFTNLRYAGDWNLWRLFAQQEEIYQSKYPLGFFNKREGQLSQVGRANYERESEQIVSLGERGIAFDALNKKGLRARYLAPNWKDGKIIIEWKSIAPHYEQRKKRLIESGKAVVPVASSLYGKKEGTRNSNAIFDLPLKKNGSILAYDADWQYPAITEQHAFSQAMKLLPEVPGVLYFAFPWATLIDLLNAKKIDAQRYRDILAIAKSILKKYRYIVTVCQHIHMLRYPDLFTDLGITHVFWTHAVRGQEYMPGSSRVKILPFPLYPVQAVEIPQMAKSNKKYLYSFVGAKASKWYLTQSRNLILDYLAGDKRGLVIGRDQWHYQKIVYEHQIQEKNDAKQELVNGSASSEFQKVLEQSIFSLCPSGSGPNSIRLWESIGYGSIPVVLADTYLPPGNLALWEEATVSCAERVEDIRKLPDQLEALARDTGLLERKRHAMRQLWTMYGPECFIYDIQKLFLTLANQTIVAKAQACPKVDYRALFNMAEMINLRKSDDELAMRMFILGCSSRVLADPFGFSAEYQANGELRSAYKRAITACGTPYSQAMRDSLSLKSIVLD